MAKGVFLLGTDTNVGKTVVAAALVYLLRFNGLQAGYFKPVSSGGVETAEGLRSFDVRFVERVSGISDPPDLINPFRYLTPVSPHLASVTAANPVRLEQIQTNLAVLSSKYDYLVVEGCGGLAVPLTEKLDLQADLICSLGLNCMVVARTGVGTINHTCLTVQAALGWGLKVTGIIFSGWHGLPVERDNIRVIRQLTGIPVVAVLPFIPGVDAEKPETGELTTVARDFIDLELIRSGMGDC